MKIKDVEKETGCSAHNIRFYEEMGLITIERNEENNYREFSECDVKRLKEIKLFRSLDISMEEIRRYYAKELTLEELMNLQTKELTCKHEEIKMKQKLCEEIKQSQAPLIPYTIDQYEEVLSHKRKKLPYEEAGTLISRWGQHESNQKRIFIIELLVFPLVFLLVFVCVSFIFNMPKMVQEGKLVHELSLPIFLVTIVLALFISISDFMIQKNFSGELYEFREKGIYYINQDVQKHYFKLMRHALTGSLKGCYEYIAYEDLKTVKVWFSMVARTPINGGNAYAIYFYLTTTDGRKLKLEPGLFGVSDERLYLSAELLKEYAQRVIDPFDIISHLHDDREAFYQYLNGKYHDREYERLYGEKRNKLS